MEDKSIYTNRRHNRHKNSQENKQKKNLFIENNDGDEVKNILEFNESIKKSLPDYGEIDVVPKKEEKKKFNLNFNSSKLKYSLGLIVLVVALFGTSYSFFNYRKEDSRQADISAGEVYVRLVENATSITLPKMYPRTDEEARSRDDNYFDFTIKGKNTSDTKSIIYTINVEDGEAVSGKTRINPQYIKVDLQQKVGQNYEYISEGVKLSDFSFTGAVLSSTTSEITREYRIRFWISDDVTISDSDPNATYTATQFNNLFATYNVSVSSKDKASAYGILAKNANTSTTINFANISGSTNGEGLYRLPGTQNDAYPIYYYRGSVENNNVLFGGYCWQIVRTTDTGGIKMIYNGLPDISGSGSNITYNCGVTREIQNSIRWSQDLSQSTGYFYADDYEIVGKEGNAAIYKLKAGPNGIHQVPINSSNAAANIATIAADYPYTCLNRTSADETCTKLIKVDSYSTGTYAYTYSVLDSTIIGRSSFIASPRSLSDVGYMQNIRYTYSSGITTNSIYGKNIEWNGSSYLVIEDTANTASTNKTKDSQHHYSCGTSNGTSCSQVRFYFLNNDYIILSNGDLLEDVIYKLTGNGSETVKQRNSGYVLNQNDSSIKSTIETWFRTNLTNEVNNSQTDYRPYIEDTVYCNDRSFKTLEGNSNRATYLQSGWNPNGGDLTKYLYFGTVNRYEQAYENGWYSTSNVPVVKNTGETQVEKLACPNEIDRFTVSESIGNGALSYPVGLLTADEMIMAGSGGNYTSNKEFYLRNGDTFWTMTPSYYDNKSANFTFYSGSGYFGDNYSGNTGGVRPVISLKFETEFESGGDGTPTNPYIVKYN